MSGLLREIFTEFGHAYYLAECIHRGVANIAALCAFTTNESITRLRYEEELTRLYSMTLGNVVKEIGKVLSEEEQQLIDTAVARRNYLAHHFWWDRCQELYQEETMPKVLEDLRAWAHEFNSIDRFLHELCVRLGREKVGLTEEKLGAAMIAELAGAPMDPLHQQRKAKKFEKIVAIFQDRRSKRKFQMILVSEDGTHWNVGDQGLAWSYSTEVGEDWVEVESLKKFLPAMLRSKPDCIEPWNYAFELANGARLVIKPSMVAGVHFSWHLKGSGETI